MKKTLLITLSAAAGFLIYSLFKKKQGNNLHAENNIVKHKDHHITHVFAKAKKKLVS